LDEDLNAKQRADCIAYSAFIESRAQPLLDLSLYVSTENYTSVTRSAYAEILQWPNQWIAPPNIRAVARKRSDHLGLSSLDVDSAASQDETSGSENAPKSLLLRQKETVTSLLGKPTHKNQFKLEALTDELYDPLEGLLIAGSKGEGYLLSDKRNGVPSSLDCLAVAYLSLMLYPTLPHEWTKGFMQAKYSKLTKYTKTMAEKYYGPLPVRITDALGTTDERSNAEKQGHHNSTLPWQTPSKPSFSAIGNMIFSSIADSLPVVSQFRTDRQLRQAASDPELGGEDGPRLEAVARARSRETYSQIAAVGTVLGLFASYLFYEGIVEWPSRGDTEEQDRRDFGEAGAMLGL